MKKPGLRIIMWGATAIAVTAVASLAISASVGANVNPLTPEDVARQLNDATASATPAPGGLPSLEGEFGTAAPTGAPGTGSTVFTSPAGSVVATCDGGFATLVSWTPNPGFRVDHVVRGPATAASAEFESDTALDVRVDVTCNGPTPGVPSAAFTAERDDHGGNSGPGGGDDHGGGDNSGPGSGSGGDNSGRDHPEDD